MKVPSRSTVFGIAWALGAPAAVSAALLLNPGDAPGAMPATLPAGPSGDPIQFYSSAATPDDAGNFTAQIDSAVTVGNSFGPSALTFWYRIANIDQTPDGVPLIALGVPVPSAGPVTVDQAAGTGALSGLGVNAGSAISFFWSLSPVLETQISSWHAVQTPFDSWTLRTVTAVGTTTEEVIALVPIPEPTTYVGLFALGLAGFAAYRRLRS
ncbi:MAG: PEP-CTERM sorting domain-containing protein [Verrucomicrobiales bacterium]|nr:PEP-CTERM sorting domain-containing protein [Verrucomicrobiales bacterium]